MKMIHQECHDFSARMDRAENIIRRVRDAGMDVELSSGKILIRNVSDDGQQLLEEVIQHRKDIAEWLSIPPADVTERVLSEFNWLREFAEEFAKTAWRRLGRLTENEVIQFYNLASAEYHDDKPPKVEPGLAAFMAIADARLEQSIDLHRLAHERAQRDGCDPAEWEKAIELTRARMAKEGRWK